MSFINNFVLLRNQLYDMGQSLSPHYAKSLIHTFKRKLTRNKITLGNQWYIIYSEKLINMKENFSPTNIQAHSFE